MVSEDSSSIKEEPKALYYNNRKVTLEAVWALGYPTHDKHKRMEA